MAGTGIFPWEMMLFWLKIAIISMGVLGFWTWLESPIHNSMIPWRKLHSLPGCPRQPRLFSRVKLVAMDVHHPRYIYISYFWSFPALWTAWRFNFFHQEILEDLAKMLRFSPLGNPRCIGSCYTAMIFPVPDLFDVMDPNKRTISNYRFGILMKHGKSSHLWSRSSWYWDVSSVSFR